MVLGSCQDTPPCWRSQGTCNVTRNTSASPVAGGRLLRHQAQDLTQKLVEANDAFIHSNIAFVLHPSACAGGSTVSQASLNPGP